LWPTAVAQDDNKTLEGHLAMKRRMGERDGSGAHRTAVTSLQVLAQSWPTPMAGTPAQNGNSAAGNSDFSRKAEALAAGLWTTPQAHDVRMRGSGQTSGATGSNAGNRCLATDAAQWQTPVADDAADRAVGKINSRGEPKLSGQAHLWGTPRASDAEKGGPNQSFGAGGTPLPSQAAQWPTPAARDHKGGSEASVTRVNGKSRLDLLDHRAEQGFSHPAHLTPPLGPTLSQLRPIWRPLRALLIASHGRDVWRRLWKGRTKRRLNPVFEEWLMGWPPGHALCACSATEWFHWQQRMRGALSRLPTASGPWIWKPPAVMTPALQGSLFDA